MTGDNDTPWIGEAAPDRPLGATRLMVISDTHVGGVGVDRWHDVLAFEEVPGLIDRAAEHARRLSVDAAYVLGDLAHRGDLASLEQVRARLNAFGCPVRVVAGNHDRAADNVTYERVFGGRGERSAAIYEPEENQGLAVGGVQVHSDDGGSSCTGTLPCLDAYADSRLLLLSHYPLLPVGDQLARAGLRDSGLLLNDAACLAPVLDRRAPSLVLHGHLHARVESARESLLQIGVAALVERPHEVTVIDLALNDETWVHVRRYTADQGLTHDARLPVIAPAESFWRWSGTGWQRHPVPGASSRSAG